MAANRNKRSVAVDIALPEGQDLVRRLVAVSDVLVENFKTGNLARYGLGYDDLKKINRKLVYCSVTGFGQTGPYAERPGYDFLIQGMGGAMSITGDVDGAPQKVGVPVADLFAGMFSGVAICAALRRAAVRGEGEYIDIGMLDTTVAWMSIAAMNYLYAGDLGRLGNAHPNIVP
jgi:crotonobetainyl-CoA:carnitine CoA-transferase CaiB-like acyl-CoA transferase